ncbi:MAG: hypothetical protein HGA36_02805 [Candidatus Moranbacteria bacterium]|nr:hypothetical protein [Candidatus Moranbacteria bacterium]
MDNSFEQIEKLHFEHEVEAQRELEKIDIAAAKMAEKYGEYESLKDFVIYLASMEKVFARSRIYDSSPTTTKDEIIKAEIYLFSRDAALDEEMLKSIRDDFGLVYLTISQVYEIAEKLLKKFVDKAGCDDFIASLRDISIAFIEAHEKHFSIGEIQDRIYRSRMKILSADGDPDIVLLEQVYAEFKAELGTVSV